MDGREVVSDSLGRSQIGTESDDSSSHFDEKSSCSQMTWPPANSILANHFGMSFFFFPKRERTNLPVGLDERSHV